MSNIDLTEEELAIAISSLLFSCSVNVVSNTTEEFQTKLLNLAKKLKTYQPEIWLDNIQFIQEDDYEDVTSGNILENFKTNLEITSFENV